jgi:hypothetical protein
VIPEGSFQVRLGGPGWCVDPKPDGGCGRSEFQMLASTVAGGIQCTTDGFLIATCPFKNLAPGEQPSVTAITRFTPDPAQPGWTEESMGLSWSANVADGGPGRPG